MSREFDACLHLMLPRLLEAGCIDELLRHPDWVGVFSTHHVGGHGEPDAVASAAEQVRGHAERVRVDILMTRTHVEALLEALHAGLPNPDVVWWVTPVLSSGRFA